MEKTPPCSLSVARGFSVYHNLKSVVINANWGCLIFIGNYLFFIGRIAEIKVLLYFDNKHL